MLWNSRPASRDDRFIFIDNRGDEIGDGSRAFKRVWRRRRHDFLPARKQDGRQRIQRHREEVQEEDLQLGRSDGLGQLQEQQQQ